MLRLFIQLILLSIFLTFSSYSKNYEKIIINGNERISNETILVFSEIQIDKTLNENSINEILKKLYKSGFFKDVKVRIENQNLLIEVIENPIIEDIEFTGMKSEDFLDNTEFSYKKFSKMLENHSANNLVYDKFFSFKPNISSYFSGIKPSIGQESIFSFAQTVNKLPSAK